MEEGANVAQEEEGVNVAQDVPPEIDVIFLDFLLEKRVGWMHRWYMREVVVPLKRL